MKMATKPLIGSLYTSAAISAVLLAVPAAAQLKTFSIDAQDAASGIPELARQADVQILVSARAVRGLRTAPVRGQMPVNAALQRLLVDTGLRYSSTDGRTFILAQNMTPIAYQTSAAAPPPGSEPSPVVAENPAPTPIQLAARSTNDDQPGREIVVTGSRIITNGNNSPTPVTVVTTESIQQVTPSNIPDGLNKLPVFSGSSNQSSLGAAERNFSGNYLNLRNVGAGRSLILFDGHRFPPTTTDNLVDTNTIPQMLIQRVEVVTGGASAVYGSDAITGVVNFVIDRNFNGWKVNGQGGLSSRGDNGSMRLGAAFGTPLFEGRGHFEASFEHYDSQGIDNKLGRAYGRAVYSTQGAGTAANPYRVVTNTRLTNFSRFGIIKNGVFADQVFGGPNNTLRAFQHGTRTGTTGVESGGDGTFYNSTLQASLRSYQGFARFDYDIGDTTHFYTQATATKSFNQFSKEENVINNLTFSSQNAFLLPQYRTALAAANQPTFTYAKQMTEVPRLTPTAWIKSYFAIAGLEGKLGTFSWDASYSHSESRQTVATVNNMSFARLYAALDAVTSPSGQIVCNVTLTNPALYPGCVPINPFGESTITQNAQDYFLQDTYFRLRNKMDDAAASINGSPFETWAGPVQVALSGEYRSLKLDLVSDAQPTDRVNCAGLRFNCTATTPVYASNVVGDQRNRNQRVTEGAVEVDIPLLKDSFIARSFNVNGAARYTHYNTSGNVKTWKVGIDWHLTDDLRIRGTRSRDIRAPNLNDLYAPVNVNPSGFNDLHTGITATVPVETSGNRDLKPEIARTITAGFVYRPSWLRGFSLAVDYYDIAMNNAIGNVSASTSTVQRECEASNGASPLCDLFIRPLPFSDRSPANFPTRALSRALNVATLKTHGVDTELNYATRIGSGNLSLRGLVAYQPKNAARNFPGSPLLNRAGAAGLPAWRATGFVHFDVAAYSVDVQERWHSSTRRSSDPSQIFDAPRLGARAYTDLTLAYRLQPAGGDRSAQFFVTVQNLFDRKPAPFVNTGAASTVPGFFVPVTNGDDPIGRYFTAGVRFRL
jgi:iron complex outermembrane receptor protein